ncbi:MAG: hypothetical protein R2762_17015 [Bryobacteraceae bacterium]
MSPVKTILLIAAATALCAFERRPSLIDEARILPSEHAAIDYWNAQPADPVARLQQKIDSGKAKLGYDPRFGYLPAVLDALNVPVSSQVLVFSKTSFQAVRIFPRVPRALYHNDTISVGYVRSGDVVEVASLDPKLGVVFYTLSQVESAEPRFEARTTECISCHAGPATLGVPGLFVRSVRPDRSGVPDRAPGFITDHRSPMKERWGGWYVSGEHGEQPHLGNAIYARGGVESSLLGSARTNVRDLAPYITDIDYLSGGSDIVSLLVLEHQTRMVNLIVRLGYETRMALAATPSASTLDDLPEPARTSIRNAAEETLRYMLFTDEAPLNEPVTGASRFAAEFQERGKKDKRGRSLHQLDLKTRLLRYPCSYLIESEAFRALPSVAREYVFGRLWEVLTGLDTSPVFASLSKADRTAIREILVETHSGLPASYTGRKR